MFKDFQNKLKWALESETPFVLYRKPGEVAVNLLVNDNSDLNIFLLHSFDSTIEKSISDEQPGIIDQEEFDFDFNLNLENSETFSPVDKEKYLELISNTIDTIQNSQIDKIVISRIKQVKNQNYHPFSTFRNLIKDHPNAFVYLWHNPENETWLGATPELLLSIHHDEIKTVSLAGTKLPENEWTQKEYDEQKFVTDYIVNNFEGIQNLSVKGPETVNAGKFQHLKSYISGKIGSGFSQKELLKNLHPTPAVCGLPKNASFEFILENEGYDRSFYSGYIGIENEHTQEYFVNLRCVRFFTDYVWIYVGGGVTADSDPEKEWAETELKSGTIMNSF